MKRILILISFLALQQSVFAQSSLGTWNIFNVRYNQNDKWSIWTEEQTRSWKVFNTFFYHEVKGGFEYNMNKSFSILGGIGRYATYSYSNWVNFDKLTQSEFRIYEQLNMKTSFKRFKFEHRYRAEQRWLMNGGYRNRFRYRLMMAVPLNHKEMGPKTLFAVAFDELFFTNRTPYFERNRVYVGFGYEASKLLVFQIGIIRQFDFKPTSEFGKNYLQLSANIRLSKDPKHKSDLIPTTQD